MRILSALFMVFAWTALAGAQSDDSAKRRHVLPHIADGGGWQSTLLVTNVSPAAASCTVRLTGLTAARFESAAGLFRTGSTVTFSLRGSGGFLEWRSRNESELASGYATVDCTEPVVAQIVFASVDDTGRRLGMATVFSSQAGNRFQVPVLTPAATLGLAIANDTGYETICWMTLEGHPSRIVTRFRLDVPSKTSMARMLNELVSIPETFSGGALTMNCTREVTLVGLHFELLPDGGIVTFNTLPPTLLGSDYVDGQRESAVDATARRVHVVPHIADGGGWQSWLIVTNVWRYESVCVLDLHGLAADRFEEADEVSVPVSTATFTLPESGGHFVWRSRNESALASGYGILDCTWPVTVQLVFASIGEGGEPTGMATVFSSQAGSKFQLPVLTPEAAVGFAIANDTDVDAACRLGVVDRRRVNVGEAVLSVPSRSNYAQMLRAAIALPETFPGGTATIACDPQVATIGLHFELSADGAIDTFNTLPPAVLEASAERTLAERAASDRATLEAFYDAAGGPGWVDRTNWKTDAPLREWHGVWTNAEGRVVSLSLVNNEMRGSISPELGRLDRLERLDLAANDLSGAIPRELGRLLRLRTLDLGRNDLTGATPSELGRLIILQSLNLSSNDLTGMIPPELGNLPHLRRLHFGDNDLTGPLPPELGRLTRLEAINLYDNDLTGPIPPELGNMLHLETLWLSENRLDGAIPPELNRLSNLRSMYLDGNQLTGTIPGELGSLRELVGLRLNDNRLSGPIPAELSRLGLGHLDLSGNRLTGSIPTDFFSFNLRGLVWLDLFDNRLTGPLPVSILGLRNLDWFLAFDNDGLCAPSTEAFRDWLGAINYRSVPTCTDDDPASETVNRPPETVAAIPAQTLAVGGFGGFVRPSRHFSDPDGDRLVYAAESSDAAVATAFATPDRPDRSFVADWSVVLWPVAAGTVTVTITARDTEGAAVRQTMTVTVRPEPHGLPEERAALEVIYDAAGGPGWTRNTNWKTAAPLGQWHGVATDVDGRVLRLALHENNLSGTIAPELGHLTQVRELHLYGNQLSGTIPAELGNLTRLVNVYLNGNQLTGELPASLTNLRQLRVFWFQDNAGLCMPATEEFEDWMNEIENRPPTSSSPRVWGRTCNP